MPLNRIPRIVDAALEGSPTAPTASIGSNNSQVATTAFVTSADNLKANLSGAVFTGTSSGVSPTETGSKGFRNITMSTSAPNGGLDGDIWLVYT